VVLEKDGENLLHRDRVRNEEVLHRFNEKGNIGQRNCLLKHVIEGKIEGKIEVTGRRGKRHKQLLYDLKKKRGSTRSHSVENSLWKRIWTCRKTDYRMNE
jgi:hypothetical protein